MRKLTKAQKSRLWKEVRKEFPDDPMMQEIHFIRLLHHLQTKTLSAKERIQFYAHSADKAFV